MKAKFDNALMRHDLMRNEPEETMEQLIEARDEFAIEFAKWAKNYQINDRNNWTLSTKDLLEIFKKENPTY